MGKVIHFKGHTYFLDKNGYSGSLIDEWDSDGLTRCECCGRTDKPLHRHEVFGGALRDLSKALGMWCSLCEPCHLKAVHGQSGWAFSPFGETEKYARYLKRKAQKEAMEAYDITTEEWVKLFGKNYLEE